MRHTLKAQAADNECRYEHAPAIAAGGLIGLGGGRFMNERLRQTLQHACGISVILIGIAGAAAFLPI